MPVLGGRPVVQATGVRAEVQVRLATLPAGDALVVNDPFSPEKAAFVAAGVEPVEILKEPGTNCLIFTVKLLANVVGEVVGNEEPLHVVMLTIWLVVPLLAVVASA
jgi:hypothetical protein